jgi:hypothetical protein
MGWSCVLVNINSVEARLALREHRLAAHPRFVHARGFVAADSVWAIGAVPTYFHAAGTREALRRERLATPPNSPNPRSLCFTLAVLGH